MTCCSTDSGGKEKGAVSRRLPSTPNDHHHHENTSNHDSPKSDKIMVCPSCGLNIKCQEKAGINDLPGLPAGVKFDPSDQEILDHLEAKVRSDVHKLHPLIDEFIQTLEGENGICYTHPEKLPGVSTDGLVRHFFHRPSKAYTTGTRKRRKVHTDIDGCETRWHKTGKTRPVAMKGKLKGYKKILVLYTNYGRQRKPEKTNWVMHQYHLGNNEDEKEGELVVSKVFFQTQPRQCGSLTRDSPLNKPNGRININGGHDGSSHLSNSAFADYYNSGIISFDQCENASMSQLLIIILVNYSNFEIFKCKLISQKQYLLIFTNILFFFWGGVAGSWCSWRN